MITPTAKILATAALTMSALYLPDAWGAATHPMLSEMPTDVEFSEPRRTGWSFNVDNDLLARQDRDRDYTGGFSVTLNGSRARDFALSLDPALSWINRRVPLPGFSLAQFMRERRHSMQFGLIAFTPDDITADGPIHDDRPYANLAFLSNTQHALHPNRRVAYQSTFTVGLLGSPLGEWVQRGIHGISDGTTPRGYDNQISDGGEPTARYAIARHALLRSGGTDRRGYDLKLATEGSVGYLTEASAALGLRWGRIKSPWWSSTSEFADYIAQPAAAQSRYSESVEGRELYFWAGIKLRARAYNALLQGQFRDSVVTRSSADLNHLLAEASVGLTTELAGLRVSYAMRFQTPEIKSGTGARGLVWAGVSITKHFGS